MSQWKFEKGLHEIGNGCWAYLQPDGSWGYSNAGLVTDGDASLLVDTLFDLPLTEAMLSAMRDATPAAREIETVVNTHANGDHCYGNSLVRDATIIASKASLEEMDEVPPQLLAQLLESADQLGPAGQFFERIFGRFQFAGIEQVKANRAFEGELEVTVGDKAVHLIEVGPAHTRGDVLVHSVADRAVFTGDILFIEGTPIMWAGPVDNWIRACERIEAMDVDVVVPGHGPIVGRAGVAAVREYLAYVRDEARKRFDAGLSAADAARDIALGDFASWGDAERIAVNVETLYREFDPNLEPANLVELFALMGELAR
ncbi:MAG: MBL fold metallo-hydrolase [Deltaproteobacteria bacterium]|nr:MBL fold metallo-hydrolase [Deltaproteobacteria bacterium]MBW2362937.1 MBL fold metallo-hydrolase [Deltaproteobacteria bacterium]